MDWAIQSVRRQKGFPYHQDEVSATGRSAIVPLGMEWTGLLESALSDTALRHSRSAGVAGTVSLATIRTE